jgi:arylsulfatase A-like enzyme
MEGDVLSGKRSVTDRERKHYVSQYDGGIAYMDFCLGEFLRQLKERGLYENTLIIITGDHGEAFGERAVVGHGRSVYQDEIRVPLIVKYPHARAKKVVEEPVSLVDLMPTILNVSGYSVPNGAQGRSLLRRGTGRQLIGEGFILPGTARRAPRFRETQEAIFSGTMKLIRWSGGREELYDLSKDPDELHDLMPSPPAAAMELTLAEYLRSAGPARAAQPMND